MKGQKKIDIKDHYHLKEKVRIFRIKMLKI